MILLAYLIKKFEYIRPLLHDMRVMLHYKDNSTGEIKKSKSIDGNEDKRHSLANIQIYLKNLKEVANTMLHHAIKKVSSKVVINDSDDSDDGFMKNFKTEVKKDEESKKKEEEENKIQEELNKKMRVFLIMWLRQIVIYNTHYVLHLAITNSNIASILDLKPSIVKATSIKYALVSLINPRMHSQQQVNNFKSMKRILDNNLTYFFENFLTSKERAYI